MSMYDVSPRFVNRSKAVSSKLQTGGVYVGIVTRSENLKIYVRVPKLGGTTEYGPCIYNGIEPAIGDRVLVGFLDNQLSELVCFGTIGRSAASSEQMAQATEALALKAPIDSPSFTGTPTSPTPSVGDSTNSIATTEFVSSSAPPLRKTQKTITDFSYYIQQDDEQKILVCSASTGMSMNIALDSLYQIENGTEIHVLRLQSTPVTIVPVTGVLLNGLASSVSLRSLYSMVTLIKMSANNWVIVGDYS